MPMPGMMPQGMPGQMPQPQGFDMNRLADMDVDIVIEAAPDMITLQHEQFEQLTQMVGAGLPIPPDVILEASQIRNKRQLVDRLKEEMDLTAKLSEAQEQMKQMQMVIQQQQRQLMKQLPEDGMAQGGPEMPPQPTPMDMAKMQDMARKADREDALARANIQNTEAKTAQTVRDVLTPPPLPYPLRG
jgi:hypothetical protein